MPISTKVSALKENDLFSFVQPAYANIWKKTGDNKADLVCGHTVEGGYEIDLNDPDEDVFLLEASDIAKHSKHPDWRGERTPPDEDQ